MTHCHNHVLITGASGFVGRALVARVATPENRVSAIGRSVGRLESFFGDNPGVSCFAYGAANAGGTDLGDVVRAAVEAGPAGARVTLVHLAGAAHDPALSDGLRGAAIDAITDELVPALTGLPGTRVVNVSSIAARSDQCLPRTRLEAYGKAKARSEILLAKSACSLGGGCVSLRPPAIWGPEAPGAFATVRKILDTRLPLPIGGVQVKRAYLHIDHLTEVLAALAARDWPAGYAETFEVADPKLYTLTEIFAAVAATEGRALRSFPVPAPILKAFLRVVNKVELMNQIFQPLVVSSTPLDNFLTELNRNA